MYTNHRRGNPTGSFSERFWVKVNKAGPTQPHMETRCWAWTGKGRKGWYGSLYGGKRRPIGVASHRAAWEINVGPVPEGLCVLHKCDNPLCVRPSHLFLGTHADNVADKMEKGRHRTPKGEMVWSAKVDEKTVRRIRRDRAAGSSYLELQARYGLSPPQLCGIVKRKYWVHVA